MIKQLLNFFIHLRLHYQFFILSGGYLMAALFVQDINWTQYSLQFLNVHVLLFGGATAYNSWWDKDEGAIGGLKHPPKMNKWMWVVSMLIQYIGLVWALFIGTQYAIIYIFSMLLFWLYSTPLARWKGKPFLSLLAIGVSTGTNSFLMGYIAAGASPISLMQIITALGVASIFLSLYPVSQVFQTEEDQKRGDRTFAILYGLKGVKVLFIVLFISGSSILTFALYQESQGLGYLFGVMCFLSFAGLIYFIGTLKGKEEEYATVMKIKFLASFSFVLFILANLFVRNFV